jgi:hypothetical protein
LPYKEVLFTQGYGITIRFEATLAEQVPKTFLHYKRHSFKRAEEDWDKWS